MRHVYLIKGRQTGLVKIGTATNVNMRLANMQIGSPDKLELIAVITPNRIGLESDLHRYFDKYRRHGEWFECAGELAEWIERGVQARLPWNP